MAYASQLDGSLSASQTEIYVDAVPAAPYPEFIEVDDEVMALEWVHANFSTMTNPTKRQLLGVVRGQLGSTRATHADNAAVADFVVGAGGGGSGLADVLTVGNDTGGTPIIRDTSATPDDDADLSLVATATGDGHAYANISGETEGGDASASATATSSDANASAKSTATTSTTGVADASTLADSVDGSAFAKAKAHATGTGGAYVTNQAIAHDGNADAGLGAQVQTGTANGQAGAGQDAEVLAGTGLAYAGAYAQSADGIADATAFASSTGTGSATSVATAAAAGGTASIGPIANATRAEIQVNGLPLYTHAAGAPGGTFVSLFYVDTTATTGGTFLWDFVTGAYVRIAKALT